MQASIHAWATQKRSPPEPQGDELRERKAASAAAVGLPWPQPRKSRGAGRPGRQQLWIDELYRRIHAGEVLPPTVTTKVPAWWKPGQPLTMNFDTEVVAALASVEAEKPVTADEGALEEVPEEENAVAKKAKTWSLVPDDAKAFMLDYIEIQKKKGWSLITSVERLKVLAPDVYGHLLPDTVRRWKRPVIDEPWQNSGRKAKIPPGALLRIVEMMKLIMDQVRGNTENQEKTPGKH